jgi:hypothetical protein
MNDYKREFRTGIQTGLIESYAQLLHKLGPAIHPFLCPFVLFCGNPISISNETRSLADIDHVHGQ